MAHFRGVMKGSRGPTSRLGGKSSGLEATLASWQGAVNVTLYVRDDGVDCARIAFRPHYGAGTNHVLYDGPVNGSGSIYPMAGSAAPPST